MDRSDLRRLSRQFRNEAELLLRGRAYHGAYYLAGYSVESALKAVIARRFRRFECPDRDVVNRLYTHDLEKLLDLSGLRSALMEARISSPQLVRNWGLVKDWNEAKRYDPGVSRHTAIELVTACASRTDGVLSWLEAHW